MLEPQQVLNQRYQLQRQLAENAGRQTWLARDLKSPHQEQIIVKLLAFGGQMQWGDLKLFEREADVLRNLNHTRIPKYRDYFTIDDRSLWFGLVQEYINGYSLKDLLVGGKRFTGAEIRLIAEGVLEILIYLHELHPMVLHRDIKPSNLILDRNNRVYLIDFGSVQNRAVAEGASFTVVGTYGYVPIEQFGGRSVPASDLYSLGASLIHLLTGTAPGNLPQENLRIKFSHLVDTSPHLVHWLERLTEPALEKRPATAREALLELKERRSKLIKFPQQPLMPLPNNSGAGLSTNIPIPEEIKGWNWGAFLLPWIWPIPNQVWVGLLVFVFSWPMMILMGVKGNAWAWKCRRWDSIEQFKTSQRNWAIAGFSIWGLIIFLVAIASG